MPKSKSKFIIQMPYVDEQGHETWEDVATGDRELVDTADAVKFIKEESMVGKFRIVSIRAHLITTEETKLNVAMTGVDTDND